MTATDGDGTNSILAPDLVQIQIHIEKHLHRRQLEVYEREDIRSQVGTNVLIYSLQGLGVEVCVCLFVI